MTNSWLGNIPFSEEEESDKLNRQIDLMFTKAPEKVGESHPKHKDFYWSGAKWLNVNDLPKSKESAPEKSVPLGLDGKPMRPANYLAPTREDILNEGSEKSASDALQEARKVINSNSSGDLGGGSSIGETNARASWLKATANSPAAKSMTHGKPTFSDDERWNLQQQHRERKAARSTPQEQTDVATKGATNYWDPKAGAPLIESKGQMPLNIAEIPKGGLEVSPAEIFNPNSPINQDLPTFGESVKAGEAMGGAGWAAGLKMAQKFLGMMEKNKQEATPGVSPSDGIKIDDDYLTALASMKFYG